MFRTDAATRQLTARKRAYYGELLRERADALEAMAAAKAKYAEVLTALAEYKTLPLSAFEERAADAPQEP